MSALNGVTSAIVGAANASGGSSHQVDRGLRFDSDNSAYLNRTPSSAGNRRTFTWSGWVKRSGLGAQSDFFSAGNSSDYLRVGGFNSSDQLEMRSDSAVVHVVTSQIFKDVSAWYHIVIAVDTTQSTSSDRVKFYVNGSQITDFSTSSYPSQNRQEAVNDTGEHRVGAFIDKTTPTVYYPFDGYLAEVNFIDGQALAPTDFGGYDSNNNWNPKDTSGLTFGTNGFRLDFSDPSNLGNDAAGSNNWTPNNLFYLDAKTEVTGAFVGTGTTHGSVENLLNNDTTSGYGVQAGTLTYTPSSTTTVSSQIKFWYSTGQSNTEFRVNGGSWNTLPLPSGVGTYTYTSFTGTVTSMEWRAATSSELVSVHQIQIDDQILVNSTIAAGIDSLIDTPTNYEASSGNNGGNYATLNTLATNNVVYENGNLHARKGPGTGWSVAVSNFGMTTGKWYCEISNEAGTTHQIGIVKLDEAYLSGSNVPIVDYTWGWGFINDGTNLRLRSDLFGGGNATDTAFGATGSNYLVGDVIGLAYDADNQEFSIYKNGTLVGNTTSSWTNAPTPGTYAFAISLNSSTAAVDFNFGQRPFMISSLPTDHLSLCTQNLADPTIAEGSTAFNAAIWSGDGTTGRNIPTGHSSDLVWIKRRNSTNNHSLTDIIRGANVNLRSSTTGAETTDPNSLTSFDTDGFTVGSDGAFNGSGGTFVGWSWDAGSSTVSNTDGSITSNVRANLSAGFSIVSYTGNGTNGATVGHGLSGVENGMIIVKNRSSSLGPWWAVFHHSLTSGKVLGLNSTEAEFDETYLTRGIIESVTSSTYSCTAGSAGNETANGNGDTHIAYCFAPVAGYSAFGEYTGNGSTDGTFVFTGFRPRFVMLKNTSSSQATGAFWVMIDTERDPSNNCDNYLAANSSDAEGVTTVMDVLSNGFKCTNAYTSTNGSGIKYIYAAFAEHPFNTARAR